MTKVVFPVVTLEAKKINVFETVDTCAKVHNVA
jgi:hypothetical protein